MQHIVVFIFSVLLGVIIVVIFANLVPSSNHKVLTTPLPQTLFSLDTAPTQSLKGNIATLSGEVQWQSRTATQPATLTSPRILQQGEEVDTGATGEMTVQFPHVTISLKPQTTLNIIQTLPANIVFDQDLGTVIYNTSGDTPISVRSLDLLIRQKKGKMTVTADEDTDRISVAVMSGSVTVAYNSADNVSTVLTIPKDKQFSFQDDTRQGFTTTKR